MPGLFVGPFPEFSRRAFLWIFMALNEREFAQHPAKANGLELS
jgi:hypothetical protein